LTKLEKDVQKQISDYVKGEGGWAIKVVVANEKGCPDLLICIEGMFIGCEVKAPRFVGNPYAQLSPKQRLQLARIEEADGVACSVASLEQFKEVLGAVRW